MLIQYQRRMSRGLQLQGSYTWAHSIDNASSDSLSRLVGTQGVGSLAAGNDRGPSDLDVRHSLTIAATYNLPNSPNWFGPSSPARLVYRFDLSRANRDPGERGDRKSVV